MNWKLISVAAIALLIVLAITALPAAKASGHKDNEDEIGAKWIAAWNSHTPEKMLSAFTDDVFYEDVAFAEVNHGHTEFSKFAADEFEAVPDAELKLVRASVHDGHGTIEWTFSGTDKGLFKTGKKFSVRGVSVIDVRDGKISRSLDFYDSATIMRQVGLLPAQ